MGLTAHLPYFIELHICELHFSIAKSPRQALQFSTAIYNEGNNSQTNDITDVGVLSPYRTAGQAGNVYEWEETSFNLMNNSTSSDRGVRGGDWTATSILLLPSVRYGFNLSSENANVSFRIVSIPEPSTLVLGTLAIASGCYCGASFR